MMKRSCLVIGTVWTLLFLGYYFLLSPFLSWPMRLLFAFFSSIAILALGASIKKFLSTRSEIRAIHEAQSGIPPEDGQTVAAIGKIYPDRDPLIAPLSGFPCIAYDYKIYREASPGRSNKELDTENYYAGVAMCSCTIRSIQGNFRLLGFPFLEEVDEKFHPPEKASTHFARHSASASFEDASGIRGVWEQVSKAEELLSDDDGAVRREWRMKEAPLDWSGVKFREKLVEVGEEVVVLGKYSALKQGFVNEGAGGAANDLYPGKAAAALKAIRGNRSFLLLFSLAYFSFFHGLLALFVWGPK